MSDKTQTEKIETHLSEYSENVIDTKIETQNHLTFPVSQCPICYNEFCKDRPKKVFSCSHSLCDECVKEMYCKELYRCPECRKEFRDEMDAHCEEFELDPNKRRNLDNKEIELDIREAEYLSYKKEKEDILLRREFVLLERENKVKEIEDFEDRLKELDINEEKLKSLDRSLHYKEKILDEQDCYIRREFRKLAEQDTLLKKVITCEPPTDEKYDNRPSAKKGMSRNELERDRFIKKNKQQPYRRQYNSLKNNFLFQ